MQFEILPNSAISRILGFLEKSGILEFLMVSKNTYALVKSYFENKEISIENAFWELFILENPTGLRISKLTGNLNLMHIDTFLRIGISNGISNRNLVLLMIEKFREFCIKPGECLVPFPETISSEGEIKLFGVLLIFKLFEDVDFEIERIPDTVCFDQIPETKECLYYYGFLFNKKLFWRIFDNDKSWTETIFSAWVCYRFSDEQDFQQEVRIIIDKNPDQEPVIKYIISDFKNWEIGDILHYMLNLHELHISADQKISRIMRHFRRKKALQEARMYRKNKSGSV